MSNRSHFGDLLLLVFIAFKLLGVITWSWWWVLSPIWVVMALIVIAVTAQIAAGSKG